MLEAGLTTEDGLAWGARFTKLRNDRMPDVIPRLFLQPRMVADAVNSHRQRPYSHLCTVLVVSSAHLRHDMRKLIMKQEEL